MPKWKGIIIHHSATVDGIVRDDWESIRRFHMSYRLGDEIMKPEQVREYAQDVAKLKGKKKPPKGWKWAGVIEPWKAIGYHWGIESVKNIMIIRQGRPMNMQGAHCVGKNPEAIGICCVGNFDVEQPTEKLYFNCAQLCANIMKVYPSIKIENIEPHRQYAHKTCPGNFFDMARLRACIRSIV